MRITDLLKRPSKEGDNAAKWEEFLKKTKQARTREENQWRINHAFFEGDQYVYLNKVTNRVDRMPVEEGEKPRHRIRITSNQIMGVVNTYLAKMTKNDPAMEGLPASAEESDLRAAKLGEVLFQYLWDELELSEKRDQAILWSLIASQGWWEIYWDSTAKKPIEVVKDPRTGEIVVGDDQISALEIAGQYEGFEPVRETIYEGEVGVEALSPFELYLIGGRTPKSAAAAVKVKGYDPEYVEERWGEKLEPDADAESFTASTQGEKDKNLILVKQLYVRPNSKAPKGKYIVWAKDKVLHESDFPYEHGKLPFVKFGGIKSPGRINDLSLVQQLIPLQKELNRTISQIVEHKNLTMRPKVIAPIGSIRTPITNEPGQVIEVAVVNGQMPQWQQVPSVPNYVFTHVDQILQRMNDVAGIHEVTQGKAPIRNIEAGVAMGLLAEQDETRMGPRIRQMERALSDAGSLMLALCKQFYIEERYVKIRGSNGLLEAKHFKGADLYGCDDIRVVPGSTLPRSKAAQQQTVLELLQQGAIGPQQALPILVEGPGTNQLLAQWEADRNRQRREIDKAVTSGELAPPEEFDDDALHLEVLDLYMKGVEFEGLPPELQDVLREHRALHNERLQAKQPPPDNVKINHQIRSEATPSVTAGLLAQQGALDLPPEQIAQEEAEKMEHEAELEAENGVDIDSARD